jgi:hypothetical protein
MYVAVNERMEDMTTTTLTTTDGKFSLHTHTYAHIFIVISEKEFLLQNNNGTNCARWKGDEFNINKMGKDKRRGRNSNFNSIFLYKFLSH